VTSGYVAATIGCVQKTNSGSPSSIPVKAPLNVQAPRASSDLIAIFDSFVEVNTEFVEHRASALASRAVATPSRR
jgi:hypothetical protein